MKARGTFDSEDYELYVFSPLPNRKLVFKLYSARRGAPSGNASCKRRVLLCVGTTV
jgi:hypothetical protein